MRDPMEPYLKMSEAGIDLLDEQHMPFVFIPWSEADENRELIELHESEITRCIAERKGPAVESIAVRACV